MAPANKPVMKSLPRLPQQTAFQRYYTRASARKIPEEKFQRISRLLAETSNSMREISRSCEVDTQTVSRINSFFQIRQPEKAEQIRIAESARKRSIEGLFSGKLFEATQRLLRSDLTISEIAQKVGVSRHTVAEIMRQHGGRSEQERNKIWRQEAAKKLAKVPRKKVIELLQEKSGGTFKHNLAQVARMIGLTRGWVSQIARSQTGRTVEENRAVALTDAWRTAISRTKTSEITKYAMQLLDSTKIMGCREIIESLKEHDLLAGTTRPGKKYIDIIYKARKKLGLNEKLQATSQERITHGRRAFNEIITALRSKANNITLQAIMARAKANSGAFTEKRATLFFADYLFRHERDLYEVMAKTGLSETEARTVREWALKDRKASW